MITCPRGYLTTDKKPGHESLNDFKDFKGKMKIGLRRSLDIIRSCTKLWLNIFAASSCQSFILAKEFAESFSNLHAVMVTGRK